MPNSRKDIILYGVIGIILIISGIILFKVSELEKRMNQLNSLQQDVREVSYSIDNVSSQVNSQMNQFLQDQVWIPEKGYQINHVDAEKNTIQVLLEWRLRDLHDDEELLFLYRQVGERQWAELEVEHSNGLNYYVEHSFLLRGNYETQVTAISPDGKRSEDLIPLHFGNQLEQRITTNASLYEMEKGDFHISIDIYNYLDHEFLAKNQDILKIERAIAMLYLDGTVIKELDLLTEDPNIQYDMYNESILINKYYNLEEEFEEEEWEDYVAAELVVIVEDGLGIVYETKAEMMY